MSTLRQRRESTDEKAARLLTSGNLKVIERTIGPSSIRALCRGDHDTYALGWDGERWHCSCPARTDCAHLRALWLVTVKQGAAT